MLSDFLVRFTPKADQLPWDGQSPLGLVTGRQKQRDALCLGFGATFSWEGESHPVLFDLLHAANGSKQVFLVPHTPCCGWTYVSEDWNWNTDQWKCSRCGRKQTNTQHLRPQCLWDGRTPTDHLWNKARPALEEHYPLKKLDLLELTLFEDSLMGAVVDSGKELSRALPPASQFLPKLGKKFQRFPGRIKKLTLQSHALLLLEEYWERLAPPIVNSDPHED